MSVSSIKTILIDDEPAALESLKLKLEMYCPEIEVIATCNTAKLGLKSIIELKPDLLFLDIEMPWMNGFELLNCIADNIHFDVVFVTAYDQYAIRAFKVKAQDYLLKPVDKDDLIKCIERIKGKSENFNQAKLTGILEEMDNPISLQRILLHTKNTIEVIRQDEIIYLQADSNYCNVYTTDGKRLMVTKTLNNLEKLLDLNQFIRIHRSYTVNINFIKKISIEDGVYDAVLKDGNKLPISRRRKEKLLELLNEINK